MSTPDRSAVISDDGLRYARGKSTSAPTIVKPGAMSCFKCGSFKPVPELITKRFFGSNQKICKDGCERR